MVYYSSSNYLRRIILYDNRLTDDKLYTIAKKRVEEKKDFFFHLIIYISINIILWIITISESGKIIIPMSTTVGWGIGVLNQGINLFYNEKSGSVEKEFMKLKRNFSEIEPIEE